MGTPFREGVDVSGALNDIWGSMLGGLEPQALSSICTIWAVVPMRDMGGLVWGVSGGAGAQKQSPHIIA